MEAEILEKLEALKNSATRYEVVAKVDEKEFHLAFSARVTRMALIQIAQANGKELLAKIAHLPDGEWKYSKAQGLVMADGFLVIKFGRTERECIMHGKLPELK